MKKQFYSLLLVFVFVFVVSAQKDRIAKPDPSEQNLRRHVEYLASEKLEGRRTGERGATYAAGYVANRFAGLKLKGGFLKNGKPGFLQPFEYKRRNAKGEIIADLSAVEAYNVIGILEGKDPVLKNEAIVIGAHYDHLGRGGQGSLVPDSTEIHHGADDNASGTAAMIELARQFAAANNNKRTLIFIGFGGEEEGLLGSKHYVNNPVFPIDKTIAMINMDMVGRLANGRLNVGGIGTATEWRELVTKKNQITAFPGIDQSTLSEIPVLFRLQLNEDGFGPSDHASFYGKQIPVLFFFTGTHLDYHKPTDTAEKINISGLRLITEYVRGIVEHIDQQMPKRPTYLVAKSTASADGRRGFSVSLGTIPGYGDDGKGMTVDGVRDDSPAFKAGLKSGDRITRLAGKEIKNVQDYTAVLGEMKANTEYEIVYVRGTETITTKITPVARN